MQKVVPVNSEKIHQLLKQGAVKVISPSSKEYQDDNRERKKIESKQNIENTKLIRERKQEQLDKLHKWEEKITKLTQPTRINTALVIGKKPPLLSETEQKKNLNAFHEHQKQNDIINSNRLTSTSYVEVERERRLPDMPEIYITTSASNLENNPFPAFLGDLPPETTNHMLGHVTTTMLSQDKEKQINQRIVSTENNLNLNKKCIINVGNLNNLNPARIISFVAIDENEKSTDSSNINYICFDVTELEKAAREDWKRQEEFTRKKISNIRDVVVPNVALQHLKADTYVRYHFEFTHFDLAASRRIHDHFEQYEKLIQEGSTSTFDAIGYVIDFVLGPIIRFLSNTITGFFETVFGVETVGTLSKIFFPVSWLASKGWLIVKKVGSFFYNMSLIQMIIEKVWNTGSWYMKFVYKNAFLINIVIYGLRIIRILFCIYFFGPQVGIKFIEDWLNKQAVLLQLGDWAKQFISIVKQLVTCISTILSGNAWRALYDCLWGGLSTILGTGWTLLQTVWTTIRTSVAQLIPIAGFDAIFQTAAEVRAAGIDLLSLDWDIVFMGLRIFLPRLIRIVLPFLPIFPILVTPVNFGIKLMDSYFQILNCYGTVVTFFTETVWEIWNCINWSGNCCFPKGWKDQYGDLEKKEADAKKKQEEEEARRKKEKEEEEVRKTEKTAKEAKEWKEASLLGKVGLFVRSDERAKTILFNPKITVNGLNIYLYEINNSYIEKICKQNLCPFPTWYTKIQKDESWLHAGEQFFSVSAQEVEKRYPTAVHTYYFNKKPKTRKKQTKNEKKESFKFLFFDKLPIETQEMLKYLNYSLFGSE